MSARDVTASRDIVCEQRGGAGPRVSPHIPGVLSWTAENVWHYPQMASGPRPAGLLSAVPQGPRSGSCYCKRPVRGLILKPAFFPPPHKSDCPNVRGAGGLFVFTVPVHGGWSVLFWLGEQCPLPPPCLFTARIPPGMAASDAFLHLTGRGKLLRASIRYRDETRGISCCEHSD